MLLIYSIQSSKRERKSLKELYGERSKAREELTGRQSRVREKL
jgi:hypothetical protein